MKELTRKQQLVLQLGGILMVLGAATYLFLGLTAMVLYAIGVLMFAAMQFAATYEGRNIVIARLRRQQMFGAFCLVLSVIAMGMQTFRMGFAQRNEWVILLTIGAVVTLYTTWRIPAELKKEKN